jgi:hypothetical protein
LGTGTFSQFEHCLRECLERERRQTGIASHITRHDYPCVSSARDYSYDPVSTSFSHHILNPPTTDHFTHYSPNSLATFTVNDIQYINVAMSKNGIPLFPYSRSYSDSYPSALPLSTTTIQSTYPSGQRIVGDVVSACRIVEDDPALRGGSRAVQNVWSAIQHHEPYSYTDHSRSHIPSRGPYNI